MNGNLNLIDNAKNADGTHRNFFMGHEEAYGLLEKEKQNYARHQFILQKARQAMQKIVSLQKNMMVY